MAAQIPGLNLDDPTSMPRLASSYPADISGRPAGNGPPPVTVTDSITVCVCTFKRPTLLAALLGRLERQELDPAFNFDVVVVDNDEHRSSETVIQEFARRDVMKVAYYCEPERSISLARNLAVRHANGNLVAFIDDDECPVADWLVRLFRTLKQFGADGVLGPVIPDFPPEAPGWLKRGRVFQRPRHESGTCISSADARTGNVLLKRSLFEDGQVWFDPAFGRTGGEDTDFFARQFARNRDFVWCDEAIAYETVPPERWQASFHLKRLWRAGTGDGEWIRLGRLPATSLLPKNLAIFSVCILALPFSLLVPKHLRMAIAQKMAYCGGMLTASVGLSLYRERD
jgi:succinoglycan biosynthesis protein ExoM